jgi:hypothetical protein
MDAYETGEASRVQGGQAGGYLVEDGSRASEARADEATSSDGVPLGLVGLTAEWNAIAARARRSAPARV